VKEVTTDALIVRGAERRELLDADTGTHAVVLAPARTVMRGQRSSFFIVRGVIAENSRTSSSYCSRCTIRELLDADIGTYAVVLASARTVKGMAESLPPPF